MRQIGKRLASALLAALMALALCGSALAAEESMEEIVARAKQGVVQLYALGTSRGELIGCRGTGFAVGSAGEDSNVFVTNWHVVTANGAIDPAVSKVYIALDNATYEDALDETDRVVPCEVLYITPGNPDMAILRATEPVSGFKALPMLSADEIMDAAAVVALGYPAILDNFTDTNGGVDDMSVTQGHVVRHAVGSQDDADLSGTKLLFTDAVISGGNSGGPLLNSDGAVVGINTYGFGEEATTDYSGAVYIDYAMAALDGLGIPYDVYQPDQETPEVVEEKEFPLLAVILIAAGCAAVVLVVVLVLVLRRKPAKVPAGVGTGGAAGMSGAAGAGAGAYQGGGSAAFTLYGPGGRSVSVPAGGLIIGRDPTQCGYCLSAETKGVSRRHCQLTVSGTSLLLTDLGSTYGTFVGGQRLEPGRPAPLLRGGSFYLGDIAVTFTVQ